MWFINFQHIKFVKNINIKYNMQLARTTGVKHIRRRVGQTRQLRGYFLFTFCKIFFFILLTFFFFNLCLIFGHLYLNIKKPYINIHDRVSRNLLSLPSITSENDL